MLQRAVFLLSSHFAIVDVKFAAALKARFSKPARTITFQHGDDRIEAWDT